MFTYLLKTIPVAFRATTGFLGTYLGGIAIGVVLAGFLSFFLARYERSRLVSEHVAAIASLERSYESERARAAEEESRRYASALALVNERQNDLEKIATSIALQLSTIPTSLERERATLRAAMQESTRDTKFDCRRLPLPESLLERLRREGDAP